MKIAAQAGKQIGSAEEAEVAIGAAGLSIWLHTEFQFVLEQCQQSLSQEKDLPAASCLLEKLLKHDLLRLRDGSPNQNAVKCAKAIVLHQMGQCCLALG